MYATRSIPVSHISPSLRQHLCALYLLHYDGSSPERFAADLEEKDEVLVLYHSGEPIGFSTLLLYPFSFRGQAARILFSGDTVVHYRHWGQQRLHSAWLGRAGALQRSRPDAPLFWFLLVKGHRTYRYLSAGFKRWFPHPEKPEPELRDLAFALASERYGAHFVPDSGILRFPESHGHLRPEIAQPDQREAQRPDVAFFLRANPGFTCGDELVCLCPLHPNNLTPLAARAFTRDSPSEDAAPQSAPAGKQIPDLAGEES